jgi:hypothetical protein
MAAPSALAEAALAGLAQDFRGELIRPGDKYSASRIASCQRRVSAGQVAVCGQCSRRMSKVLRVRQGPQLVELVLRDDPSRVVTLDISW